MKKFFMITLCMAAAIFADPSIDKAVADLNSYSQLQKNLNIQNADLSYGMRKALIMADLMLDAQGKLRLDQKNAIKTAFLAAHPQEYEVNMSHVLATLDGTWQSFFDGITAPKDSLMLQSIFSSKAITDRHAKVAVLAAMLAPYNQGAVGDCFAVTDVIRDHEEYFRRAASDYKSILMNGYVERFADGKKDHFYFLPLLADPDRDQNITINFSLLDAPGFAAACTLMDGDKIVNLSDKIMEKLPSNPTPAQVIDAMAQTISENRSVNVDLLRSVGEYAFSSLTNNPILRATEAAFASMAEERASGAIRQNIHDCLAETLSAVLPNNQTFLDIFNQNYRLVYNLDIPLAMPSADGNSTDGGFQLYTRTTDSIGTRVATPEEFRNLVLQACNQAMIVDPKVISYLHSDDFLKDVLWNYDPQNKTEPDPVHNYQNFSRTPMQSCDGDDPYAVDDIDTGTVYESHVQAFTPKCTKDLINWCLNLAKTVPPALYPMNSPQHAFNFAPAVGEMVAFTKSGLSSTQWLQKMMLIPGVQVSSKLCDPHLLQAVVDGLIQDGLPNTQSLQKMVTDISQKKLSLSASCQKLLSEIVQLYPDQSDLITMIFDTVLLQSLSPNDQAVLEKSAIRFAFTNWNQGLKDIYFCAFFNPRTEQIAFGTILEDGTHLAPMSENDWVNGQRWDVDLMPAAPNI